MYRRGSTELCIMVIRWAGRWIPTFFAQNAEIASPDFVAECFDLAAIKFTACIPVRVLIPIVVRRWTVMRRIYGW